MVSQVYPGKHINKYVCITLSLQLIVPQHCFPTDAAEITCLTSHDGHDCPGQLSNASTKGFNGMCGCQDIQTHKDSHKDTSYVHLIQQMGIYLNDFPYMLCKTQKEQHDEHWHFLLITRGVHCICAHVSAQGWRKTYVMRQWNLQMTEAAWVQSSQRSKVSTPVLCCVGETVYIWRGSAKKHDCQTLQIVS